MENAKPNNIIQSLQVGISIIDSVAECGKPMRFSDILESTNITKSNLYKYLNTLTQLDLLYRDKITGHYTLGAKLIQYGMLAVNQEDITSRATPFLEEICQHTNLTSLLTIWTNNGPIIIKMQSPPYLLNIGAQLGTILSPNSSAGKIFLSFLDEDKTKKWIEDSSGLNDVSQETLNLIQQERIAFANEPLISSVSSVSVPILNYQESILGSLTIVGFKDEIPDTVNHPLSTYLLQKSVELSECFGYRQTK